MASGEGQVVGIFVPLGIAFVGAVLVLVLLGVCHAIMFKKATM